MIIAALLVFSLSSVLVLRVFALESNFEQESARFKIETGSYDKDFIAMVDRLEMELAERASFPYLGGKDPMTGKTRILVARSEPYKNGKKGLRKPVVKQETPLVANSAPVIEDAPAIIQPEPVVEQIQTIPDPVRLTAIIYDDFKKAFTAIMMVGERSFSVELGDKVHGRVTREISAQRVILEDAGRAYNYDISGNISNRAK